jgi:hypothetical protein
MALSARRANRCTVAGHRPCLGRDPGGRIHRPVARHGRTRRTPQHRRSTWPGRGEHGRPERMVGSGQAIRFRQPSEGCTLTGNSEGEMQADQRQVSLVAPLFSDMGPKGPAKPAVVPSPAGAHCAHVREERCAQVRRASRRHAAASDRWLRHSDRALLPL